MTTRRRRRKTASGRTARGSSARRKTRSGGKRGARKGAAGARRGRRRPRTWRARLVRAGLTLAVAGLLALVVYAAWLDRRIVARFDGAQWALPAQVYAQPLELYAGRPLSAAQLRSHLQALGYRAVPGVPASGQYRDDVDRLRIGTRPFSFWDGQQASRQLDVRFAAGRIAALRSDGVDDPGPLRLDPQRVGSIVPLGGEDRIVLAPDEVPALLRDALVAVEDQDFYRHHGLDLSAIARAAVANLRAGGVRQGGSTLTQQLVKSAFLSNERSLSRKLREALMAVLLDARYAKDTLLVSYVNEIYLGQDGARAIHGFGLASRFYFQRPLDELELHQTALLVALVRGPSLYDPRRHPQAAAARRDLVLTLLAERGVIDAPTAQAARARPLDVAVVPGRASGSYPAFVDVVRAQLVRDYRRRDLASDGLRIFTTLDVATQTRAESIAAATLARVEREHGIDAGTLETAAVIADPGSGELLAVVGGRRPGYAGFNRARDALRPVGSLIKPVVYLEALDSGAYHLASPLPDEPLEVALDDGQVWRPQNFSGTFSGQVPLYRALAESVNLPAAHVGLAVGPQRVAALLRRLGVQRDVPTYPALVLGAASLTPLDVAQAYGTLAGGGFVTPQRAVRAVTDAAGVPLTRYPLEVTPAADPDDVAAINRALQLALERGTARRARALLPPGLAAAAKTGTSNDLRDAWVAGYAADRLAVVWVGRDDNRSTGLTGAQGALPIWADLMAAFAAEPFVPVHSERLLDTPVDYQQGSLSSADCGDAVLLPLPADASLPVTPGCDVGGGASRLRRIGKWLRERLPR